MPFMKHTSTGAIVGPMSSDSAEFRFLQALRQSGQANRPLWEEIPVEDAEAAGALIDGKVAVTVQALADAVGAGADQSFVVGRAPFAGTVAKVEYFPTAAINGAATNNRTFNAVNVASGAGTTVVATQAMTNGNNMAAQASNVVPLSGVANALNVNNNDEIEWQSLHVGTGIADPGGLVVVTFTRE